MLRPWLFAIARNECLTILRRRRPWEELNGEPALGPDPVRQLELREELRDVVAGVRRLPESERAALVLTEVHGLSQRETGTVLGVRAEQVKAYVYQARSKLVSERDAREADCDEIREELATARGAALLRGRLRRHMRGCPECRTYAAAVSRQRRQLAALLPIAPSLALRSRALEQALGLGASDPGYAGGAAVGASVAGAAAEIASGGFKALAVKIAAGVAAVGAGAGVGVSVLSAPIPSEQSAQANTRVPTAAQRFVADVPSRAGLGGLGAARVRGGYSFSEEAPGQPSAPPEAGRLTAPSSGSVDTGGAFVEGGAGERPVGEQQTTATTRGSHPSHVRPVDPTPPKTEEQRHALEAERRQGREARLHAAAERKRERTLHGPAGAAKTPKTQEQRELAAAERKKAREEHPPEGNSRAPRSEEERRISREARLRHREEARAAEKEKEATP
jgi:hypothetical protein